MLFGVMNVGFDINMTILSLGLKIKYLRILEEIIIFSTFAVKKHVMNN